MARALILGAGSFGGYLAAALQARGYAVDLVDREATAAFSLPQKPDRLFTNNAMNIRSIAPLRQTQYDCCVVCFCAETWALEHILRGAKGLGIPHVAARITPRQQRDAAALQAAGADRLFCVEQLAGDALAQQLLPPG